MILAVYFVGFFAAGFICGAVSVYIVYRIAMAQSHMIRSPEGEALLACQIDCIKQKLKFGSPEWLLCVQKCMASKGYHPEVA